MASHSGLAAKSFLALLFSSGTSFTATVSVTCARRFVPVSRIRVVRSGLSLPQNVILLARRGITTNNNLKRRDETMRKQSHLYQLKGVIKSLKEQGAIDDDTSSGLSTKLDVLEHAMAVRNHKLVLKTVTRICEILLDNTR